MSPLLLALSLSAASPALDVDLTLELQEMPRWQAGGGGRVTTGAIPPGAGGVAPMGKQMGVGLQVGFPTSVTLKYLLEPDQGLVFGVGAGSGFFYLLPRVSFHVDYVLHPHVIARAAAFKLSWYIGGGAWVTLADFRDRPAVRGYPWYIGATYFWLGGRMPLGLSLAFTNLPIEVYLEATPALLVFPELAFGLGGTLGFRFYF